MTQPPKWRQILYCDTLCSFFRILRRSLLACHSVWPRKELSTTKYYVYIITFAKKVNKQF
jgi:hypothetical protein